MITGANNRYAHIMLAKAYFYLVGLHYPLHIDFGYSKKEKPKKKKKKKIQTTQTVVKFSLTLLYNLINYWTFSHIMYLNDQVVCFGTKFNFSPDRHSLKIPKMKCNPTNKKTVVNIKNCDRFYIQGVHIYVSYVIRLV